MDYNSSFKTRAKQYKYAIETYPNVLKEEFKTAAELCTIAPNHTVLNILAGGTPLDKYFTIRPLVYKEYEISGIFGALDNIQVCKLDAIPEPTESIDTIITLAALHHLNDSERNKYYKECSRILKSGTGKLIIGDVIENSKEAHWLNKFVATYNSAGHNGIFMTKSDKTYIENNGFIKDIQIKSYPWTFDDGGIALIDFCRNLFGLDLATDQDILDGINRYLNPEKISTNIIVINWTLMYFISTKRLDAVLPP